MTSPNFLYIGTDKAGSTWLFRVLSWHPQVYMTPSKDIYFFDKYFDRGLEWYQKQFRPEGGERIICEISHDYLYAPEAAARIHDTLPGVRLMVCLREPVERAFSAYLYLLKHGLFQGSFEEALDAVPALVENGSYVCYLKTFLSLFGRERIFVGVFDDLQADSNAFAGALFDFLGIDRIDLPEELRGKTLAAAKARSLFLARLMKKGAWFVRDLGLSALVGRIKSSPWVDRMLYDPYTDAEKPRLSDETRRILRADFAPKVAALDDLLGMDLQQRWGYR